MGPVITNALPYLPPGYSEIAYPAYPQAATHVVAIEAGLHDDFSLSNTGDSPQSDLSSKGELKDILAVGTEIIVFNESIGYQGQWVEVIVVGNLYHNPGEEIPKLYVKNNLIEKLPNQRKSFNFKRASTKSPSAFSIPSNWRNKPVNRPFYDTSTNCYYVIIKESRPDGQSPFASSVMKRALGRGIEELISFYDKDLLNYEFVGTSFSNFAEKNSEYFSFARAESVWQEPRNSPLDVNRQAKYLIKIPQVYFDSIPFRESVLQQFENFAENVENTSNSFLDQANGTLNTDTLRNGFDFDGDGVNEWEGLNSYLPEGYGRSDEVVLDIYGEEVVVVKEDYFRTLTMDPEQAAKDAQEAIDQLNNIGGQIVEDVQTLDWLPDNIKDPIDDASARASELWGSANEGSENIQRGLESTLDTINTWKSTVNSAPSAGASAEAFVNVLSDPNSDFSRLPSEFVSEANSLDREIDRIQAGVETLLGEDDLGRKFKKLEGTPIYNEFQVKNTLYNINPSENEKQYREILEVLVDMKAESRFTCEEFDDKIAETSVILLGNVYKSSELFEDKGTIEKWKRIKESSMDLILAGTEIKYLLSRDNVSLWLNPDEIKKGLSSQLQICFNNKMEIIFIGFTRQTSGDQNSGMTFYGDKLKNLISSSDYLGYQNICGYLFKMSDIVADKASNVELDEFNLIQWASKYVYPRPRFKLDKPKSDVTDDRKRNQDRLRDLEEINNDKKFRRDDVERIGLQVQEAINAVEEPVDTLITDANYWLTQIQSPDDWFNYGIDALKETNPIVAASLNCIAPTLDFGIEPELIPELDLNFVRNPVILIQEIIMAVTPPDPEKGFWEQYGDALYQFGEFLFFTAVKESLEYVRALCLQAQAVVLAGIVDGMTGDFDLFDGDSPAAAKIDISSSQDQLASSLYKVFVDNEIISPDVGKQTGQVEMISNMFRDVTNVLTAAEFCQLCLGEPPEYVPDLVLNITESKYSLLNENLNSRGKVKTLFRTLGDYLNKQMCDEALRIQESATIYSDAFKNSNCNVSTDLRKVRENVMKCSSDLSQDEIDTILREEEKEKFNSLKSVIDLFTKPKAFTPPVVETRTFDKQIIGNYFSGYSQSYKQDIVSYSKNLISDAIINSELSGNAKILPKYSEASEIIGSSFKDYDEWDVGRIYDEDYHQINAFKTNLWKYCRLQDEEQSIVLSLKDNTDDNLKITFEIYKQEEEPVGNANEIVESLANELNLEVPTLGQKQKFSISRVNQERFQFSKRLELPPETTLYIESNFPAEVDQRYTEQQFYYGKFMKNKFLKDYNFKNHTGRNVPQGFDEYFESTYSKYIYIHLYDYFLKTIVKTFNDNRYFDINQGKSGFENLAIESKNLGEINDLIELAAERYSNNKSKDLPPPEDPTIPRTNYNSLESSTMEACIRTMIRVYIMEFFVKSFSFSFSYDDASTGTLFKDYIFKKLKDDIRREFGTIFNFKFFYLGRGIHQDNQSKLSSKDYNIDYIFKKHIDEQYDILSKSFKEKFNSKTTKEIILDSFPVREINSNNPQGFTQWDQASFGRFEGLFYYEVYVESNGRKYSVDEFNNQEANKGKVIYTLKYIPPSQLSTDSYIFATSRQLSSREGIGDNYEKSFDYVNLTEGKNGNKMKNFEQNFFINTGEPYINGGQNPNPIVNIEISSVSSSEEVDKSSIPSEVEKLKKELYESQEISFFFDYLFDLEGIRAAFNIYTIEYINKNENLNNIFSSSKQEIRNVFNLMDQRGRNTFNRR